MNSGPRVYIRVSLLMLVGILLIWVLYLARSVLWPFVLAILLVYLLSPLVDYLSQKKLPRVLAVLCVYVIFVAALVTIVLVITPGLANSLQQISKELPQYMAKLEEHTAFLKQQYDKLGLPLEWEDLTGQIIEGTKALARWAVDGIGQLFSGIFFLFLSLVVAFYLLKDAKKMKAGLMKLVPQDYREQTSEFVTEVDQALRGYIRGQAIIAAIVGIAIGVGLFLFGVQYAILLGVAAGVFNVVPYLGPVIAIIPALLIGLLREPFSPWVLLWILLLFVGVNQVEAYFLAPHILAREVKLHPVAVIVAIVVGGAALGIVGVLLAIPALAALKSLLKRIVAEKVQS